MSTVITSIDQLTPSWLTDLLQAQGYLREERVLSIQKQWSWTSTSSFIYLLGVKYTGSRSPQAPARLFLKLSKPDPHFDGQHEVVFYQHIAPRMEDTPAVRCFDAAYSPEIQRSHLLLEDLSQTHATAEWPLPPAQTQCERAIDTLAAFHASWWNHSTLGTEVGELPNPASVDAWMSQCRRPIAGFFDFLKDRLAPQRREVYEQVLSSLPQLAERLYQNKLTLIHGDAHLWNILFPKPYQGENRVYLVDWSQWRIWPGAAELAYMMALHWYPERRARWERALVKRYYDLLLTRGIQQYSWDDCWYDYRWGAIMNIFMPAYFWFINLEPYTWWSDLEKAFLAFEDLQCAELL